MKQYKQFLRHIMNTGTRKDDRTGTGTLSVFGYQMRFDLREGFPLVTTKKVHFKSIVGELLWFLSGSTNANELRDKFGVTIWDEWADPQTGELGPVYGSQWRNWAGIDQIATVVESIKTNPDSRRHIVSAWNVADLSRMALPPCHAFFQFYVSNGRLSCQVYQRSADAFLGVPFNIASYAMLTNMIAVQCGLKAGELIWTGGDCHVYLNHISQVTEQLSREELALPTLCMKPADSIFDYTPEHFYLLGYDPHPAIKAPVAV